MENIRQTTARGSFSVALSIAHTPRRISLRIAPLRPPARLNADTTPVTGLGAWPDAWYYPYFAS